MLLENPEQNRIGDFDEVFALKSGINDLINNAFKDIDFTIEFFRTFLCKMNLFRPDSKTDPVTGI